MSHTLPAEPTHASEARRGAISIERSGVHLPYLDGIRALAAMYVVAFHAVIGFTRSKITGPWRLLRGLFVYGHEAVAIFIVLSGYG